MTNQISTVPRVRVALASSADLALAGAVLAGPPNPGKPLQPVGVSGSLVTVAQGEDPKFGPCEDFSFISTDDVFELVSGSYESFAFCSDDLGKLSYAEAFGGLGAMPVSGGGFDFFASSFADSAFCCGSFAYAEQGMDVEIELLNDYTADWRFDWHLVVDGLAFFEFSLRRPGEPPIIEIFSNDGFAEVELGEGTWLMSISTGVSSGEVPGDGAPGGGGPASFDFSFTGQVQFEGPVGDLDGDFLVTGADLAILLGEWASAVPGNPADLDGSGLVDGADLALLLGNWTG